MKTVSARFLATVPLPHRVKTVITCTPPGESPMTLDFTSASVTAQSGTGKRKGAEVQFAPIPDFDLYEWVSTPGALFSIEHGFRYSANVSELVPVFDGEASSGASPFDDGSVSLSLTDLWAKVERTRFIDPYAPGAGLRANIIADTMAGAVGVLPEDVTTDGGSTLGGSVWERDRGQAIKDLANDGGLEAYVDSNGLGGQITVRTVPTLVPEASVWTIRSGDGGTMIVDTGQRNRPLDRLYNTVVVVPADDTQTWTRQTATVPANHPRHPDNIGGIVPYFWSSSTITTAAQALAAAEALLSRVVGTTESIALGAVANAALEPGDVITILKSGPVGLRIGTVNIIDGWTLDCVTGAMAFDTRSANAGEVEEAA